MSELAALAAQGHSMRLASQPATIKLAGQCYRAARTGFRSEQKLVNGDFIAARTMSFEILAADLSAAGQPPPRPEIPLVWLEGKMTLLLKEVLPDPTGTLFVLRCEAPPQ
jgi:hypothetical protein